MSKQSVGDKILIVGNAMLAYEYQGVNIRDVGMAHFPQWMRKTIFEADVVIVFSETEAKVIKNRLSEKRLQQILLSNMGNYVASRIYFMEGESN